MRALILLPLLALTACGTPQERCINGQTRDLRVLNRLIAETEGNLGRGYAYEQVTITTTEWRMCQEPPPAPDQPAPPAHLCLEDVNQTVTQPKAIDLAAEAAKLKSMKAKRAQLSKAAAPAIAQCKAQYPE
jgi:hypothetical protein